MLKNKPNILYEICNRSNNDFIFLELLIESCSKFFDTRMGGIMHSNKNNKTLSLKEHKHLDTNLFPNKIEVEDSIFEETIKRKEVTIKNNLSFEDIGFELSFDSDYNNLLIIPLCKDEDIYGVLFVVKKEPFEEKELENAKILKPQISYLVHKNQSLDNMRKNVAKLSTLKSVSNTINSTLDLTSVMELAIDVLIGVLGVSGCAVFLNNEGSLELEESRGLPKHFDIYIEEGYLDMLLSNKEVISYNEVPGDVKENLSLPDAKSILLAPLKFRNELKGAILVVNNMVYNAFEKEDREFLKTLANQITIAVENAKTYNKMETSLAQLQTLKIVSNTVNSTLNPDVVMDTALDVSLGVMGGSACGVMLVDDVSEELVLKKSRNLPQTFVDNMQPCVNNSFFYNTVMKNETIAYNQVPNDIKEEMGIPNIKSFIATPLEFQEAILGIIFIVNTFTHSEFKDKDVQFLETISNQVSIAVQNARMYKRVEQIAIKDGLTNLFNHSYFQETLGKEIERSKRYKQDLTMIILDIDNFKNFNDTYGHPTGDKVLQRLSRTLEKATRNADIVARYGGEEFAIILPETNLEGAEILARRINERVRNMIVTAEDGTELSVTVSIGVAAYNINRNKEKDLETVQKTLISNADKALYQAKENGKDKYCLSKQKE